MRSLSTERGTVDVTDWLKLLDLEPESIASVKPIRPDKGEAYVRSRVI